MKINVIKPSSDAYRASFEITRDDEYYKLASLLGFQNDWVYNKDPIDAVKSLVKYSIEKIESIGITSTPLVDIINDLGNEKIKELEKDSRFILNIGEYEYGYIASISSPMDSPVFFFKKIKGYGENKKESVINLLNAFRQYEETVHIYVSDLEKAVKNKIEKLKSIE